MKSITIIAFDQHAATTVAAVLLPGQRTPALHSLTSDSPTILRLVRRLRRDGPVQCCYEAGPCGFELQRALTADGIACDVIAPALIPRRAGDRIKTDRRDATQLAVLYRAGALTAIHVPTEDEEAVRDLLRCREDIRADLLRARHRLGKFLLRHGRRFTATTSTWSLRHYAWLRAQTWPLPALTQTHEAYLRTEAEAVARLQTVDAQLQALVMLEPLRRARPPPAVLPRHGRHHGADDRRRIGRCPPLPVGARTDGVRGPDPVGAFERDEARARHDHENRQCPCPSRAR